MKYEETKKIYAKKSLGQNFLTSQPALAKIVEAGKLTPNSIVLEIGPGKGALTEKLLATGATIVAIEKDRELVPYLEEKFAAYIKNRKFLLTEGDILTTDLTKVGIKKNKPYTVIANIPYYITGELTRLFLERPHKPERIVFLVQKEVAERIVKKDGKESILSLSVQAYGTPRYVATVPRGAFAPSPKVDSAIVAIELFKQPLFKNTPEEKRFFEVIKSGFKSKRKKAISNLAPLFEKQALEQKFTDLDLNAMIRPEQISFQKWHSLAKMK